MPNVLTKGREQASIKHFRVTFFSRSRDRLTDAPNSLSIVIPTWCEAAEIGDAVDSARTLDDGRGVEVIVADGASPDETATIATAHGAHVVTALKGRGAQLAAGARAATGEFLLFLHADARLPAHARVAIDRELADADVAGGNFALRFVPETPAARLFTRANDIRRRRLGIYYGDSAIFVRKSVYVALGGFRDLPLFEDYDFVQRLQQAHRTAYIQDVEVRASARRFERRPFSTLAVWSALQVLYSCGVPPISLARLYRDLGTAVGK